jgi:transcriptional regulator with XRE-family HTH domain
VAVHLFPSGSPCLTITFGLVMYRLCGRALGRHNNVSGTGLGRLSGDVVPDDYGVGMAKNQRLADALVRKGLTAGQLAVEIGHNPKTVERWVSGGQVPYPRSREMLARVLDAPVALLFPELASSFSGTDELVGLYATRAEVPASLIVTLASEATRHIDLCAYAATWLWDSIPGFAGVLAERSAAGAEVRVCLGDPESEAVRVRGVDEGIGDAMAGRCRLAISYAAPLVSAVPGAVRLTPATLYASIFRFDDEVLANFHLFGNPAAASPVLHLRRRRETGIAGSVLRSFDAVWAQAEPRG